MMADQPTLDQRRAAHAWQLVRGVREQTDVTTAADEKERKKRKAERQSFVTQVRKLPTRVLAAGLGPALAFLEAKGYVPTLLAQLAEWFDQQPLGGASRTRLLHRVVTGDSDFLRFATAETLAYMQWVVRFTEAELKVEEVKTPEPVQGAM